MREYERRLQSARKSGCDVGNVTARTIDHWHRVGWYELFYRRYVSVNKEYLSKSLILEIHSDRWHGDPATTRPAQSRNTTVGGPNQNGGEDPDIEDDTQINFPDPVIMPNGINNISHDRTHPVNFINPQTLREPIIPPPSISPITGAGGSGQQYNGNGTGVPPAPSSSSAPSNPDQTLVTLTIPQGMLSTYLQFLQVQTQTGKLKLEYLRRREEREEKESAQRRETERLRMEREAAEFEHNKQKLNIQQKTERALVCHFFFTHPLVNNQCIYLGTVRESDR